jgi:hypothetical protein
LALFLLGQRGSAVFRQIEHAATDDTDRRRKAEALAALEKWQLEEWELDDWQAGLLIGPPEED